MWFCTVWRPCKGECHWLNSTQSTPKLKGTVSDANNFCWAFGELAVKVRQEISPIVLMTIISSLVSILKFSEKMVQSHLGGLHGSILRFHHLIWSISCNHGIALSMNSDDIENEDALHGLCAMVRANPSRAKAHYIHVQSYDKLA
ncbi:transportin-1-like isoform X1 [Mercurialis annua]|uniref:transportin-1-like isoform X1 n=1 Tax=Mercurialis annua TaxID=3986 RepID=UPI00215F3639|nr:transportin-1-like isoform X1 [Mercurialis annua]